MKKLLILGANPETVSLIKKAKDMGFYTIVTDNNPQAFAKAYADKPCNVDAMDIEGLVNLAKEENVCGIVVGVAESLLPTYYEVCKILNLPCYSSIDKFKIMINKELFKNSCNKYHVPTIREYSLKDKDVIKFPVIVKPVDSCSSKGISVCYNLVDLDKAVDFALSFSPSKNILIEQYMTGDEVISYYVMQDGEPIFVGMCDRYTYKQSENIVQLPTSYIFPSRHIDSYMQKSDYYIKNMIKGLELDNGSIFFQCFVDEQGVVRTYEPGYRLNGAQEHMIIEKVSGIDAKEMYINYAVSGYVSKKDLKTMANPKSREISCKLSPLVKCGKITRILGLDEISKLKDVVSINPSYNEGDVVSGLGTLKQIICRFFIVSNTKTELIKTIKDIYSLLVVKDENGDNMLIGDFDTNTVEQLY